MIGFKAALGATHAKADMVETPRRVGDAWEMIIVKDGERLRVRIAREDDAFEDPILEVGEPDRPDDLVADRPVAASPMEPTEEPAAPRPPVVPTVMASRGGISSPASSSPHREDLGATIAMALVLPKLPDRAKPLLVELKATSRPGDAELIAGYARRAIAGDLGPLESLASERRRTPRDAAAPPSG